MKKLILFTCLAISAAACNNNAKTEEQEKLEHNSWCDDNVGSSLCKIQELSSHEIECTGLVVLDCSVNQIDAAQLPYCRVGAAMQQAPPASTHHHSFPGAIESC